MNVPKPRPPRPHSSRLAMLCARRHRAAAKPTAVTNTNRMMTTVTATQLTPVTGADQPERHDRDEAQRRHRDHHAGRERSGATREELTFSICPVRFGHLDL